METNGVAQVESKAFGEARKPGELVDKADELPAEAALARNRGQLKGGRK
jgi:hypothetical protein